MSLHTAADADRVLATRLADVADLRHLPWEIVPVRHLTSSLSPRKRREDPEHVRLLAETDRALDPLLVHRPTMRVIDGMHRLRAAVLKGRSEIAVRFFDGSEADAFVLSVRLNVGHGLPLTLDERKEAARRILASHPHWSDRAVAESTGLSAKTVATVRHAARRAGGAPALPRGPRRQVEAAQQHRGATQRGRPAGGQLGDLPSRAVQEDRALGGHGPRRTRAARPRAGSDPGTASRQGEVRRRAARHDDSRHGTRTRRSGGWGRRAAGRGEQPKGRDEAGPRGGGGRGDGGHAAQARA